MIRRISGTVVGVVVAMLAIMLVEFVGHAAYPPPAGLNMMTPAGVTAYLAAVPMTAMMFPVAGWFLGALVGGWTALKIGGWGTSAWLVAGLIAVAGVYNATQIPAPLWMQICTVLAPALGGWAAVHFGMRRTV